MSSSPVHRIDPLRGDIAHQPTCATCLGPTEPTKEAPAGTIRGDLGADMIAPTCVHASDGPGTGAEEKKRFFPEL